MGLVIALHLPTAAQNTAAAQSVATNPNNVANIIGKLKAISPANTQMNVISAAAISGAVHAADFPPQGGTLHVDTSTGAVAPAPLGMPAPAALPAGTPVPNLAAMASPTPSFFSSLNLASLTPTEKQKMAIGAAGLGVAGWMLPKMLMGGPVAAVALGIVGALVGKKLADSSTSGQ